MALELSPDEFRRLGARVLEECAAWLSALDGRRIAPDCAGEDTVRLFDAPPPEDGLGEAALDALGEVAACSRAQNGRYFGYVLGSGEPVAALGDLFASVLNANVTAWRSSPAAVTVERVVVGWLARAVGCEGMVGSLVAGGSAANLLGLALARTAAAGEGPRAVYATSEAHLSIHKSLLLLGFAPSELRTVPTDERLRMRPDALEAMLEEDARAGARAVAVVASAGTVSTGAIDPIEAIAPLARRHGAWLHVDGAYGALAALAGVPQLAALSLADSLSLDPHKWLYQPLDVGCALYKEPELARRAFAVPADYAYAQPAGTDPIEAFAFFDQSFELSRRFRALKLWLSLRYHGLGAFRRGIALNLAQAERLGREVEARPELELLAPVGLSVVCLRVRQAGADEPALDALNAAVLERVVRRGRVYLSAVRVKGRFGLRACITNHRTRDEDVRAVVDEVLAAAESAAPRP